MLLFFMKERNVIMKLNYRLGMGIVGTAAVALLWYVAVYPYTQALLTTYEHSVCTLGKNIRTIGTIEQKCTECTATTCSLESDYTLCLVENRTACSDDGMTYAVITDLESHHLDLKQFQLTNKEKKEWYRQCGATLSFDGDISDVLLFFKTNAHKKQSFVPSEITITMQDAGRAQVSTTIHWMRCDS
jgi:hypothetical protein